jgi:hypothetical protein
VPASVGCAVERRWELFPMSHGTLVGRHARRWRARRTRGVWQGIASDFTVCVSGVRCRAAWGHGVPATVCTVRHSVSAISLAWWRVISTAACCGALLTVAPCLRQSGTLSSGAGRLRFPITAGRARLSRITVRARRTTPVSHLPTYTSSSSPSNASTPYSITPHSTSSSASVHNKSAPGPTPVRPLYA